MFFSVDNIDLPCRRTTNIFLCCTHNVDWHGTRNNNINYENSDEGIFVHLERNSTQKNEKLNKNLH
jgi:hypothetical protein